MFVANNSGQVGAFLTFVKNIAAFSRNCVHAPHALSQSIGRAETAGSALV